MRTGGLNITVAGLSPAGQHEIVTYKLVSPLNNPQAVEVFNKGDQALYVGGRELTPDVQATAELADSAGLLQFVRPGATVLTSVAFTLPANTPVTGVLVHQAQSQWRVSVR